MFFSHVLGTVTQLSWAKKKKKKRWLNCPSDLCPETKNKRNRSQQNWITTGETAFPMHD